MNRKFRLKQSTEFMRVRRFGKSYAHPLIVLVVISTNNQVVHIGVVAGRKVGKAFERNRVKRMLREAIRSILPKIKPGWDIVLIGRRSVLTASLPELRAVLNQQLEKANLLIDNHATFTHP